ncbi:hypothetical protein E3P96_03697, partial [Wallemia ichthyophaga]
LLDRIGGSRSSNPGTASSSLANRIGPPPTASTSQPIHSTQHPAIKRNRGTDLINDPNDSIKKKPRQENEYYKLEESKKHTLATQQPQHPPKSTPMPQSVPQKPYQQESAQQAKHSASIRSTSPPKKLKSSKQPEQEPTKQHVKDATPEILPNFAPQAAPKSPNQTSNVTTPSEHVEDSADVNMQQIVETQPVQPSQSSLYENLAIKLNEIINKNLEMKRSENDLIETFEQKQSIKSSFGCNSIGISSTNYQKDLHKFDLRIAQLEHSMSIAGKLATELAGELLVELNELCQSNVKAVNNAEDFVDLNKFNDFKEFTFNEFKKITTNNPNNQDLSPRSSEIKNTISAQTNSINSLKEGFRTTRNDIYEKMSNDIDRLEEYTKREIQGAKEYIRRELREMDPLLQDLNMRVDDTKESANKMLASSNTLTSQVLTDATDSMRAEMKRVEELYKEKSKKNEDEIYAQNNRIGVLTSQNEELQQDSLRTKISLGEIKRQFTSLQSQIDAMKRQSTQSAQTFQTPQTVRPAKLQPSMPFPGNGRSVTPSPNINQNPYHNPNANSAGGVGQNMGRGVYTSQSMPPTQQQSMRPQHVQRTKARLSAPSLTGNRPLAPQASASHPQVQSNRQQGTHAPALNVNDTSGRPYPPHQQKGFNNHSQNW